MYLNSFPYLKLGYGAALSLILTVIILACTMVQMALTRPGTRPRDRRHGSGAQPETGGLTRQPGRPRQYLLGAICIALSAVMLAPLVVSISASLKTTQEAAAMPPTYFPHQLSLDSYAQAVELPGGTADLSVQQLAASPSSPSSSVWCSPFRPAMALARFPVPGKELRLRLSAARA